MAQAVAALEACLTLYRFVPVSDLLQLYRVCKPMTSAPWLFSHLVLLNHAIGCEQPSYRIAPAQEVDTTFSDIESSEAGLDHETIEEVHNAIAMSDCLREDMEMSEVFETLNYEQDEHRDIPDPESEAAIRAREALIEEEAFHRHCGLQSLGMYVSPQDSP